MRNARKAVILAAAAFTVLVVRHPVARISLETHRLGDPAPHRMLAAVDLGLMGVSVLYTWTSERLH